MQLNNQCDSQIHGVMPPTASQRPKVGIDCPSPAQAAPASRQPMSREIV